MMKNGEVFKYEKAYVCAKFPLAQIKRLFLSKSKCLSNEIVWRYYLTTKIIKKYNIWYNPKCKEWLTQNPVTNVNDDIFLLHEETLFNDDTKEKNDDIKLQSI